MLALPFLFSQHLLAQQLAFPSATGFGAFAAGGRCGIVCVVDNLNDSGPGSFREAIEKNEPRTVIFSISGTIELTSPLIIKYPFLTIAGQTAPGDGICIKNFSLKISGTHDIVIRHIRVRPGIEYLSLGSSVDAIEIRASERVIIDHCSFSWGTDELLNTWHGTKDFTIQWCIFSEPLNNSVHVKGAHGYAASIGGIRNSFHNNLFAHAPGRNPSIAGQDTDSTILLNFSNNVVFNWEHRSCDGKPRSINFTGNYYKPGPATIDEVRSRLVRVDNCDKYGYTPKWHVENNFIEGYPELSENNWAGAIAFEQGTSEQQNRSHESFDQAGYISKDPELIYHEVLDLAGALCPKRDAIDNRIVSEVKSGAATFGNGIIDKVEQVGGWPQLRSEDPPRYSDKDGMPDNWEIQSGLDPFDPADRNIYSQKNGFTKLER